MSRAVGGLPRRAKPLKKGAPRGRWTLCGGPAASVGLFWVVACLIGRAKEKGEPSGPFPTSVRERENVRPAMVQSFEEASAIATGASKGRASGGGRAQPHLRVAGCQRQVGPNLPSPPLIETKVGFVEKTEKSDQEVRPQQPAAIDTKGKRTQKAMRVIGSEARRPQHRAREECAGTRTEAKRVVSGTDLIGKSNEIDWSARPLTLDGR